jgi:TorA maturation chaperone TorD
MSQDKVMNSTEIARINAIRASVYLFLSRAFKTEVSSGSLQNIIAAAPEIRLLTQSQDIAELTEGNRLLERFVQKVEALSDEGKENLIAEMRVEFATLFMGIGADTVHLVESAYYEEKHLRYEKPIHDVQAAYLSLGFTKDADFSEPDDHCAIEFEFMATMCRWTAQLISGNEIENALAYLTLQKEFIRDHVGRWVPELCERLRHRAKSDFYRSIAHLTSGFVAVEDQMLSYLIVVLKDRYSF